ncbi:MAG: DUF554 domain-containing protein [Spirochaetaceae bacterium]|jgi:uncharacterized membrane protein YqgA involved in biofilm formation|nr:DUF554 domain-containing protein [Spirochaetaceae bacterium]
MIAVFINCAAVIIGALAGLLFSRRITEDFSQVVRSGAGVATLVLGMQMAFKYENVIFLVLSLILGGILGSWWDIEGKITLLGKALERYLYRKQKLTSGDASATPNTEQNPQYSSKPSFAYAFLNASVLFCVGAMSIVGSFQAGIDGDYSTILTKSVLDGFMAVVFGAAMGVGTAFSAVSILVYQGLLTLAAGFLRNFVSETLIAELTGVGGALIVMIGFNLLGITKLKTANYLPAMLLVVLFVLASPWVTGLF